MTTTYYHPPSHLRVALINPIFRFLVLRFGLGSSGEQDAMRVLRVTGRTSGREYDVPVRVTVWEGQRYVLSMLGEAQWVKNLRAASEAQIVVGKRVETVHTHELVGDEKAAFLTWYCQHPEYAMRARFALKADTQHLTPEEVARLAGLFPVFRLEAIH